jgi:glutathione peroxidase-family protein
VSLLLSLKILEQDPISLAEFAAQQGKRSVYDFTITKMDGEKLDLGQFRGSPLLLFNSACGSMCGFTSIGYNVSEDLHQRFSVLFDTKASKKSKLVVIGFPSDNFGGQEYANRDETVQFCTKKGVTHLLAETSDMLGPTANPLFRFLKAKTPVLPLGSEWLRFLRFQRKIMWNFEFFFALPEEEGGEVLRFLPSSLYTGAVTEAVEEYYAV